MTETRIEKAILNDKLKELGTDETIALEVPPEMSVRTVINKMIENQKCSVAVVDSNHVIEGIFTERSLILRVCNKIPLDVDKPIKEAMLKEPVILNKDDSVAHGLHEMFVSGYSYAIIDDDPIRVVNIRDILSYIVELHPSLGGFQKVLQTLKESLIKTLSEEEKAIFGQVEQNQDLFYKAFTLARMKGKLKETERINIQSFLKRFVPAIKAICKDNDCLHEEFLSVKEIQLLMQLIKIFEQKKEEFLEITQ
jgi:signal-transduction protein with cAMP-binding, CBS, and nucleotidyltransferase domain